MKEISLQNLAVVLIVCVLGAAIGKIANTLISYLKEEEQRRGVKFFIVQLFYVVYVAAVVIKFGLSFQAIKLFIFGFVLIVTAVIDFESKYIYIHINILGGVLGVILNILGGHFLGSSEYVVSIYSMLIGALIGFFPIYLLSLFGGMGEGDAWLLGMIGVILGWKMTLVCLFISIVSGGIISIFLVIFKKYGRKTEIPFGPFIAIGAVIVSLWGVGLLNWYINTMRI